MKNFIGLDIGGTKIAGAAFDEQGTELMQVKLPVPTNYPEFIVACCGVVELIEQKVGKSESIGVGAPGIYDRKTGLVNGVANITYLSDKPMHADLEAALDRKIGLENDANCLALAEAAEGAGKGYRSVFGLIMGTGIGGGFILDGHAWHGVNGLCGEIGHLPMPYYDPADGERVACNCGQTSCIEKMISGSALARLYHSIIGTQADGEKIAELAREGDAGALHVLDRYYTVFAKAMVVILHTFDPEIITVSGGLNSLPGLYDEVPKRWGRYAIRKEPSTKFVPAAFGAIAGLRGAAWVGRSIKS